MNDLERYQHIFDEIVPWSGIAPAGFTVDFLGTQVSKDFRVWRQPTQFVDGRMVVLKRPRLGVEHHDETWFEAVDWFLAAREARERFVMVTLGANYGYQAVACSRALQRLNPLPMKLVAVEPIPENVAWIRRHMRDNGIDPDEHWIIQAAVSGDNEPVLFPVGAPGVGAQNCISTNEPAARRQYVDDIIKSGRLEEALRGLLLHNSTGLRKVFIPGRDWFGEIKFVSAVTLADVLGPFDWVDLLEADMQESEIVAFPPFRALIKKKVRRIHLGTHGRVVHRTLHQMFHDDGWEIVFSYEPESLTESAFGPVKTNDGILSVRNPAP